MNLANDSHSPVLDARARRHLRPGLGLAALATTALIAGCGSSSSSSSSSIEPGKENTNAAAEIAKLSSSTSSTATTGTTPSSGPLSTEPKVTPPKGPAPTTLVTKDLIVGTGAEAKAGEMVTVNYVGVLYKNGKVFDASWKRNEPFTFALGEGKVIPGWDKGVAGMKVGGRRELIIPAPLAYGAQGSPPTIPPNSALVFVVDLLAT